MNPENDTPKIENCSRIIREFLKDYSRSPTRIRRKWFCIPKIVAWNPIIRLSNCKIIQRTRKSKMKHTTPTTVLFFNLTEFPITISVTSIATNVNGCGIGVMGNTLTMDMDKTENKIQTVHVYPYAFKDVNTRDYFSSDNSMTNSKTEREKIRELLQYQKDIFSTDDKDLEKYIIMRRVCAEKRDKYDNKKSIWKPFFGHLMEKRMNKIENAIENAIQQKLKKGPIHESYPQKQLRLKELVDAKINAGQDVDVDLLKFVGYWNEESEAGYELSKRAIDSSDDDKSGLDYIGDAKLTCDKINFDGRPCTGLVDAGPQNDEETKKFWGDKKLKIGAINRNLRLSSAMIDPCSHRYYLTIRIHDTDEGRLIMTDNIHRTNYDIIIRHEDIKRPSKKTETAP